MLLRFYLKKVINQYKLPETMDLPERRVVFLLRRLISEWAGKYLCEVKLSGSRAKGTAICNTSDLDLFISLSSTTPGELSEIYNCLYDFITKKNISARKQNVSIGINYQNYKIDLVPARRQDQFSNDHSLYKRKSNTWTKTNIDKHISRVRNSGRIDEILALKIWRSLHKLEFPSIYLESFVIESLYGKTKGDLGNNFIYLLEDIRDNLSTRRVLDPANSNNVLSDELTIEEKKALSFHANNSLQNIELTPLIW